MGINFTNVSNWDNARFVHFCDIFPHIIAISIDIGLLRLENRNSMSYKLNVEFWYGGFWWRHQNNCSPITTQILIFWRYVIINMCEYRFITLFTESIIWCLNNHDHGTGGGTPSMIDAHAHLTKSWGINRQDGHHFHHILVKIGKKSDKIGNKYSWYHTLFSLN